MPDSDCECDIKSRSNYSLIKWIHYYYYSLTTASVLYQKVHPLHHNDRSSIHLSAITLCHDQGVILCGMRSRELWWLNWMNNVDDYYYNLWWWKKPSLSSVYYIVFWIYFAFLPHHHQRKCPPGHSHSRSHQIYPL